MKYGVFIAAVLVTNIAAAQVKEGKIIYERKVNLHKDMPPEAEQFRAMVPEFQSSKMELLYNGTQSLFHALPNDEEDQMPTPGGGDGRRMSFRFGGMDAETFRDYDKETMVESRELGPKKYLIDDSLKTPKWKLEEDTMTIMGYLCHKATTTMEMRMRGPRFMPGGDTTNRRSEPATQQQPVVAWYTEAIESQAGPDNFFGLPGLILKTDLNNGSIVYTPISIESNSDKALVKAPTSGKKITREEYRKMMQEQMQNMRGPGGPGGPIIRIVQ